jgi:AraC family transcriptional regulator, regulatory protein of adaptative response / methylated-DNA-[protein]-cysteine methyltransferase
MVMIPRAPEWIVGLWHRESLILSDGRACFSRVAQETERRKLGTSLSSLPSSIRKERKMTETIRYAWGDSSLGSFMAAQSCRGLVALEFTEPGQAATDALQARFPEAAVVEDPSVMAGTIARLGELIEHPERASDLPLDPQGSGFERRVWEALRLIPAGETVSYGEIAARLDSPRETREVAEACAANSLAVLIPCHRVVRKDGSIAGYRWGFRRKRALLERERQAIAQP